MEIPKNQETLTKYKTQKVLKSMGNVFALGKCIGREKRTPFKTSLASSVKNNKLGFLNHLGEGWYKNSRSKDHC